MAISCSTSAVGKQRKVKLKNKTAKTKDYGSAEDLRFMTGSAVGDDVNATVENNTRSEWEGSSSESKYLKCDDKGDDFNDPESKQRKSGVLYFSHIPPKFTPSRLQAYFEKCAPNMIGRVYCARNKNSKTIENRFSEGWLEVKRKRIAKALAARFDNSPVGGKKRDYTSSVLWNIKYLTSFKWVHLMEQLQYERTISAHRMNVEIAQARRIAAHFEEQVDKGKHLKRLEEKALKAGGLWNKFQRDIEQRKVIRSKRKKLKSKQPHSIAKDENVLHMIFVE